MVLDLKRIELNKAIRDSALWVVEQIPGYALNITHQKIKFSSTSALLYVVVKSEVSNETPFSGK